MNPPKGTIARVCCTGLPVPSELIRRTARSSYAEIRNVNAAFTSTEVRSDLSDLPSFERRRDVETARTPECRGGNESSNLFDREWILGSALCAPRSINEGLRLGPGSQYASEFTIYVLACAGRWRHLTTVFASERQHADGGSHI
jgi:hypothetical protein